MARKPIPGAKYQREMKKQAQRAEEKAREERWKAARERDRQQNRSLND